MALFPIEWWNKFHRLSFWMFFLALISFTFPELKRRSIALESGFFSEFLLRLSGEIVANQILQSASLEFPNWRDDGQRRRRSPKLLELDGLESAIPTLKFNAKRMVLLKSVCIAQQLLMLRCGEKDSGGSASAMTEIMRSRCCPVL